MSSPESDRLIDAQLRDVALPPGMLDRLRAIAGEDTAEIDRRLRDVALPDRFTERLRAAVGDCELDEALAAVEPSPACFVRVRTIPHQRRRSVLHTAALAACLMLLVGAAYGGAVGGVLLSLRPDSPAAPPLMVIDEGPVNIAAANSAPLAVESLKLPPSAPADGITFVSLQSEPQALHLADRPSPGAFGELWEQIGGGLRPWDDALRLRWSILGAAHRDDDRPPLLERAQPPIARGVEPPLAPGYDRAFLHVHGAHPIIFPARHKALQSYAAPLSIETASFDRAERLARQGRLPDADQVRAEDFLAAVGCRFLPPAGPLGIRTAAGPSPFGQRLPAPRDSLSPQLLQIGVKAGPLDRGARTSHLTVALDTSASMQWAGGLELTRRALSELVDFLGPRDRLSLVSFDETPQTLFDAAGPESAEQMRDVFHRLRADGGTNLAAGLRQALSAAMSGKTDPQIRSSLALVTDSRDASPPGEQRQIEEMLTHAAAAGLHVVVIDVSDAPHSSADWHSAIVRSGHDLRRAQGESDVLWALVESLAGRSAVVAADVELNVRFNPRAVVAYRLIGHDANAIASVTPAAAKIDLRSRQEASVLYEVWLAAGDVDDVATAEAAFVDPAAGKPARVRQRISRLQFAPSVDGSALSLQAAALAAETGEILHGSPFAPPGREGLTAVRQAAARVNPQLEGLPEFRRLVSLVDQLLDPRAADD